MHFNRLIKVRTVYSIVAAILCFVTMTISAGTYPSDLTMTGPDSTSDQDDMCVWIHPCDPSRSTIICSDKAVGTINVYDLKGGRIQGLSGKQPGNIDVRYGFPLGGKKVDIVAVNYRTDKTLHVFTVDPESRTLVDSGATIETGENYGQCLYRSPRTGKYYSFTNDKSGAVNQIELRDAGGKISGEVVRRLKVPSQVEGCVADDETSLFYLGEEAVGIWKFGAEPTDSATGTLIAKMETGKLEPDVEGLAIYYAAHGEGYLLASSQGRGS